MANERADDIVGATSHDFARGQKIFGRYTLVKILGRGGMGILWLARDEELEREVALKFLPDLIIRDAAVLSDLKRETRRCLELTHKNIVRIYAATGLTYGESLRTSLTNTCDHLITVVASTLDANGGMVKQASLVVSPGQTLTFNTSRTEAGGDEQTKQLRNVVTVHDGDAANNLVVANQVVNESTGKPIAPAPVTRLAANRNETLVRDTTPSALARN